MRYAIVLENKAKADAFFTQYYRKDQQTDLFQKQMDSAYARPLYFTNWQKAFESALISILGQSANCGIGIYISNNPGKTNFINLN